VDEPDDFFHQLISSGISKNAVTDARRSTMERKSINPRTTHHFGEIQDDHIAVQNKPANLTSRESVLSATMGKKVGYKSFISSSRAGESSVNASLLY